MSELLLIHIFCACVMISVIVLFVWADNLHTKHNRFYYRQHVEEMDRISNQIDHDRDFREWLLLQQPRINHDLFYKSMKIDWKKEGF